MAKLNDLLVTGDAKILGELYANLIGNATKANGVADYNDNSRIIQIGYQGASLAVSDIAYIAGYKTGGTQIKDIKKEDLMTWLGLGRTTAVNAADENYTTYMIRGTSLNSSETNPTVNGAIAWTYE